MYEPWNAPNWARVAAHRRSPAAATFAIEIGEVLYSDPRIGRAVNSRQLFDQVHTICAAGLDDRDHDYAC
jgi:hypothetical protein